MLKSLTLRTKIIIFSVAALIGIFIIVQAGIENRRKETQLKAEYEVKLQAAKEEKEKQEAERKKAEEEELKKKEEQKKAEEKKKALEEKYNQAKNAFDTRKYWEAATLAEEIIKEEPQHYAAYNLKGIALSYAGKFDAGMADIDKSLEIKPDYGYARFNKALAYELYGHYDKSLQWYDKALEVEDFVWSYYGKASIYGRRGDVANTVKYLKIAIEKHPDPPAIKKEAAHEADFNKVKGSKEFQELIK